MDHVALKAELTDDPLARGYSGMTDEQAAADLNDSEYRTVNYPVELDGLNLAIREAGKWTPFKEKAILQTVEGTYDNQSMAEFMDLFPSLTGANQIDLQSTYISGLLTDCVTEGSMGSAVATAISNYGEKVVSRSTELEFGAVRTSDVTYARAI